MKISPLWAKDHAIVARISIEEPLTVDSFQSDITAAGYTGDAKWTWCGGVLILSYQNIGQIIVVQQPICLML
jgi:hypothetical protein